MYIITQSLYANLHTLYSYTLHFLNICTLSSIPTAKNKLYGTLTYTRDVQYTDKLWYFKIMAYQNQ